MKECVWNRPVYKSEVTRIYLQGSCAADAKQETNSNYPAHTLQGNPLKINSEKCRTQSVMTQ